MGPETFEYRIGDDETCAGFIAEEVPDLVASRDRKGLSVMDFVAVLTRVIQQRQIEVLSGRRAGSAYDFEG